MFVGVEEADTFHNFDDTKEEENPFEQTHIHSGAVKPDVIQEFPPIEVRHAKTTTWLSSTGKGIGFVIFILYWHSYGYRLRHSPRERRL